MEDKLIIGGREFNSRFILGSGKYSLDLIDSAVRYAGAEIITLYLRGLPFYRTHLEQEMQKKQLG